MRFLAFTLFCLLFIHSLAQPKAKNQPNLRRVEVYMTFGGNISNNFENVPAQMNNNGFSTSGSRDWSPSFSFSTKNLDDMVIIYNFTFRIGCSYFIRPNYGLSFNYGILPHYSILGRSKNQEAHELEINGSYPFFSLDFVHTLKNQRHRFYVGPVYIRHNLSKRTWTKYDVSLGTTLTSYTHEINAINKWGAHLGYSFNLIHKKSFFIDMRMDGTFSTATQIERQSFYRKSPSSSGELDAELEPFKVDDQFFLSIGMSIGFRFGNFN